MFLNDEERPMWRVVFYARGVTHIEDGRQIAIRLSAADEISAMLLFKIRYPHSEFISCNIDTRK